VKNFAQNYYDLLTIEFAGINLTRINEYNDFYNKQILDSIEPYNKSEIFKKSVDNSRRVIDIGFGGGFPILPLAHILPECKFLGIETRGKKVKVVEIIANKLELRNVKLIHNRIENVLIDKEVVCTFKAVGKVFDFLNRINTNKRIQVFFYKGPGFYELEADQIELCKKNWKIIEEKSIEIPGTEKRYLIGFENIKVPHGTIDKELVKVSSFF
jgi:16S rRNA (guanine527-N7)-methyltransferase